MISGKTGSHWLVKGSLSIWPEDFIYLDFEIQQFWYSWLELVGRSRVNLDNPIGEKASPVFFVLHCGFLILKLLVLVCVTPDLVKKLSGSIYSKFVKKICQPYQCLVSTAVSSVALDYSWYKSQLNSGIIFVILY